MLEKQKLNAGDTRIGRSCSACDVPLLEEDAVGLVPIGPGADEEARKAARTGQSFTAARALAHWACITGKAD